MRRDGPGDKTCDKIRGERHDENDVRLDEGRGQKRDGDAMMSKRAEKVNCVRVRGLYQVCVFLSFLLLLAIIRRLVYCIYLSCFGTEMFECQGSLGFFAFDNSGLHSMLATRTLSLKPCHETERYPSE